jgi:ComF family protein
MAFMEIILAQFNRFIKKLKHLYALLLGMLLPPVCLVCEEKLHIAEAPNICASCWPKLPFWRKDALASPILPKYVDSFNAPFVYEEPLDRLIKEFKYEDGPELAKPLARYLLKAVPPVESPLILPVPLHTKRLWKRQFNQAGLLSCEVAKKLKCKTHMHALKRVKHTPHQMGKSASARKRNLKAAFKAERHVVKGKNIVPLP